MNRKIFEFSGMLAGAFFLTMAINLFYKPAAIFAGGVPGLAIIIMNFLGSEFYDYLGYIILAISVIFFVIQLNYLGKQKVFKAMITSATFISLVQLTTGFTRDIHISDNLILMAIGGSILAGLGIGLILSNGYSFIGTIGLAEIITKKLEVSPGKGILMVESGVIVVGTLVIGIEQAMVSAIALYLLSKMVQSITYGMYQYKQVLIVSPELDHIKNRLTREISENSSVLIAQNAAREEEQNLLMIVIRYDQFKQLRDIIREYDPHAFVIASDVTEMLGEGVKTV